MSILINKLNFGVVTHDVANATYTIAGNNSVSNVATGTEIISGVTIKRITWGSDTGSWTVKRGSNTILVLSGTNEFNFSDGMSPINLYPAASLVFTLNGSANGFIMAYLQKRGTFINPADLT